MEKMILHLYMPSVQAELFVDRYCFAAILDFAATDHQGAGPTCSRWFLKISWPALSACQISKRCHKVHDSCLLWHIPLPLL